jgi:AcrR family transcriptional regulator
MRQRRAGLVRPLAASLRPPADRLPSRVARRPAKAAPPRANGRREEIIHEAAHLFDLAGYRTATLEDIAAAVGLAKPTLYHYFPTKDAILYAIHDEFQAEIARRKALRDEKGGSATDQLVILITDIVELTDAMPSHTRIFLELDRELTPRQRSRVLKRRKAFTDEVKALVRSGVESGEFAPADPSMLTMAVLGMASWTYKWFRPNGQYSSLEVAQQFARFITEGIRPRPEATTS